MNNKEQQFKDEAIRLTLTSTKSIAQTARDFRKGHTLFKVLSDIA